MATLSSQSWLCVFVKISTLLCTLTREASITATWHQLFPFFQNIKKRKVYYRSPLDMLAYWRLGTRSHTFSSSTWLGAYCVTGLGGGVLDFDNLLNSLRTPMGKVAPEEHVSLFFEWVEVGSLSNALRDWNIPHLKKLSGKLLVLVLDLSMIVSSNAVLIEGW